MGGHTPRIIALMNQKGGVGKTTTTVNLGAALAEEGHRVLLIDLDPQSHLTLHLGIDPAGTDATVYDLLTGGVDDARRVIRPVTDHLSVIPAEVDLAAAEAELVNRSDRLTALRDRIRPIVAAYDFVMIDCPPSLGLLTLNGLAAAGEVIVPMQAHFLALQGLSKLLETVQVVRQQINRSLVVSGVVLCMHDGQTNLSREVVADLQAFFEASRKMSMPWSNAAVFDPPVRRNIKLAECPSFGKTIFDYEPWCPGACDYRELAASVAKRAEPTAEDVSIHVAANPMNTRPDASDALHEQR